MSALPKVPAPPRPCPFCGVVADLPHETQEGCIAALHTEIGRMRGILANLRPTGVRPLDESGEEPPAAIRLALD